MEQRCNQLQPEVEKRIAELLAFFSPAQREIITDPAPIKQVIAAAGSGKTRTVIGLVEYRLRMELESHGSILLLSFSRKAAGEMLERLPQDLHRAVEIRTFHGFCYRVISRYHPDYVGQKLSILGDEEKLRIALGYLRRHGDQIGGIPFELFLNPTEAVRDHFSGVVEGLRDFIESYKREQQLLEYDDLVEIVLRDLQAGESYLRPLRECYSLIVVDEFQDTDPDQLLFLQCMQPERLLVVGDDYQGIYGFRRADIEIFLRFADYFPGARLFYLSDNYRSLDGIVKLGNEVIRASSKQLEKKVTSKRKVAGSKAPVTYRLTIEPGEEERLAQILPNYAMVLCRTNYRVGYWRSCGVGEAMTIHKSKGLEFPLVVLDMVSGWSGAGASRKMSRKERQAHWDEEVRVAYVGLTRAENFLLIVEKEQYEEGEREAEMMRKLFGTKRLAKIDLTTLSRMVDEMEEGILP